MVSHSSASQIIGQGAYTFSRAAQLAGVRPSTARRWILGYSTEAGAERPPVLHADLPPIQDHVGLSFINLIELRLLAAFRDEGLSLQKVRKAADYLSSLYGVDHPLAWNRLSHDGRDVFVWVEQGAGENVVIQTTGRRVGHCVLEKVVEPYFHEIDFDPHTNLARRWYPAGRQGRVVVDPSISFGEPVLEGTRISTRLLFDRLRSGDDATTVAKWYGINRHEVEAAGSFEAGLLSVA